MRRFPKEWKLKKSIACSKGRDEGAVQAGYQPIAPLLFQLDGDPGLTARATTLVIVGTHRNGLQFRSLDQTECDTHVVKPFLQFAVHITPPSGKYPAANF
jgi:hypothetical protein